MTNKPYKQRGISNILVIAFDKSGNTLNASTFHDEQAAQAKAMDYLDAYEDVAHIVKYYVKFRAGSQSETVLIPYSWISEEA